MRKPAGQDGMTLVEVLVAATILVLGIGATVTALTGSRQLGLKAERKEQALTYAQADAERFRSMAFGQVGTASLPDSGDATNPDTLVVTVGGTQVVRVKPLDSLLPGSSYQRLVPVVAGGTPQSQRVTIGASAGTVTRVVSWEESCALDTVCTGSPTAKRVTVRVQLDAVRGGTLPAAVVAEAVIVDPDAI